MTMNLLPKVELHLHLEGAAPPSFIKGLAKEKNIDINRIFNDDGSYRFTDFWEFLKIYEAACTTLQKPEDFYRLTMAVLEESAASGVIYSETFLSPDFCGGRDLGAWREYLHAIQEAAAQAEKSFGITLRGIVTCIRHFGPEKARQTGAVPPKRWVILSSGLASQAMKKLVRPKTFCGRLRLPVRPDCA
jgi:adenosine deaminase